MFRTLLRKYHTFIGLFTAIPMLVLITTGFWLIIEPTPSEHLIQTTVCDDGQLLMVTNKGVFLDNKDVATYFPVDQVAALSCKQNTIDLVINYGALFTTAMDVIKWNQRPLPDSDRVTAVHRHHNTIILSTLNSIWQLNSNEWVRVKQFDKTMSQTVYELHSGWFNGVSFQWLWQLISVFWVLLIISGVWIFVRLMLRKKKS